MTTTADPRGTNLDIVIAQGKTFKLVVRWETEPFIYKAITGITRAAPARVTAAGHGIPDGWRAAVVSVLGMKQINAATAPPKDKDFQRVTVVDADNVELNAVNASQFGAYSSGGYLQFYTPQSLVGCAARMKIRDVIGGTELVSLTSPSSGIVLDDAAKTITITIGATATAAYAWLTGVWDLEIEDGSGEVTGLFYGAVTVTKEVTA